jgi:hypothetical protein
VLGVCILDKAHVALDIETKLLSSLDQHLVLDAKFLC